MANILLMPGNGGKYTSEAFAAAGTGADTIDASRASRLAFQVAKTGTPTGTITVEQTFGAGWAALTSFAIGADGDIALLDATKGPFGRLRFVLTWASSGTVTITLVDGSPSPGN